MLRVRLVKKRILNNVTIKYNIKFMKCSIIYTIIVLNFKILKYNLKIISAAYTV